MVNPIRNQEGQALQSSNHITNSSNVQSGLTGIGDQLHSSKKTPHLIVKAKELFFTLYESIRDFVLWVVTLGRHGSSRTEIFHQIAEEPEELGKEFAKEPIDCFSEAVMGCLLDPKAVEKLHEDKGVKFQEAIRALRNEKSETIKPYIVDWNSTGKATVLGLVKKAIVEHHVKELACALERLSTSVSKLLSEAKSEEVAQLRRVFAEILPAISKEMREHPDYGKKITSHLFEVFVEGKGFKYGKLLSHSFEFNRQQEQDLRACFGSEKLKLRQLARPQLISKEIKSEGIEYRKAFVRYFLEELQSAEELPGLVEAKDHPLIHAVFTELKQALGNKYQKRLLSYNLIDGLKLIDKLNNAMKNTTA